MTHVEALREAGPHAIETFYELKQDWWSGRFEIASCAVVYGDKANPTHCVRLFKAE